MDSRVEALEKLRAEASPFLELYQALTPDYQMADHIRLVARYLNDIEARKAGNPPVNGSAPLPDSRPRLAISLPPRHSKTTTVATVWPAYLLRKYPWLEIAVITSRCAESRSIARWVGSITGEKTVTPFYSLEDGERIQAAWRKFDLVIIDDPISPDSDLSNIDKLITWYIDWEGGSVRSLLKPDGVVVMVCSRSHVYDLMGYCAPGWITLNLPAIADEDDPANDPLGRIKGQALWPERFGLDRLLNIKHVVVNEYWQSHFQGKPY